MKTTDLVYVIGNGSKWGDNELRFSLRSVSMNLSGAGNIYIIGECPDYLKNVIHIPADDIFNPAINADGNMIHKLLIACNDISLTDDFLFMNDDFIINKPMVAPEIAWMHKGDMALQPEKYWTSQLYRYRLRRTFEILKDRNLPTIQYDYHAPMLMNKHLFRSVMARFDFASDIGYTFRSLYGNSLKLPAIPVINQEITVFKAYTFAQLNTKSDNIKFIGYNDLGLNNSLKWWLIGNFSSKCQYESNYPEDRIFDLWFWQKRGKQYAEGVAVFGKYWKHKNLIQLFKAGETKTTRAKLEYKLVQSINEL